MGVGGCTNQYLWFVGRHGRQYFGAVISFLIKIRTVGINKVFCTRNDGVLKGGEYIAILKSAIKHGDGNALATVSDVVQTMTVKHLNLFATMAVDGAFQTVPWVETRVGFYLDFALDAIGCLPYHFAAFNVGLFAQTSQKGGVGRTY